MNRTRSYLAILTVVGSLFVGGLALAPNAAAHTCDTNYVDHLMGDESSCGDCDQKNAPHQHDYTVGPIEYDDDEIVSEVTVSEACSGTKPYCVAMFASLFVTLC